MKTGPRCVPLVYSSGSPWKVVEIDSPAQKFRIAFAYTRPAPHGPSKLSAMHIRVMEATPSSTSTNSIDMIQFAVILIMALERILKAFTASPCRHVLCKTCCSSFELDMASPRERSASDAARDEKVNEGPNQS